MKWYYIKFSNEEIISKSDTKFISQFVKLLHSVKHPDNLGLYSLKFQMDDGLGYYASAPEEAAYKLKELLAYYPSTEVSRPNLKVLKLELGKTRILEDQPNAG